jgi:hypothetical protein
MLFLLLNQNALGQSVRPELITFKSSDLDLKGFLWKPSGDGPFPAVLLHHFDRWQLPFADGLLEAALGRGRRFARDIDAIDKNIKVVVPKYFETYSLE